MKDRATFLQDLNDSRKAVNEFADKLCKRGIQAWLPPERTTPSDIERRQYSDDGDLMLQVRVEHKVRRNLEFTSRQDYPYDTVIVDEVYNFEQKAKGGPPLAYVIENAGRTHAAVIYYAYTRPHWKVEARYDAKQKRHCEFYVVDKQWVRFCEVEKVFDAPGEHEQGGQDGR